MDGPESADRGNVDQEEVARFQAMADEWWDANGKFRPLHLMNPCRLDYIGRQIAAESGRDLRGPAAFEALRILDIGCGGGLISEPMRRLGAEVVGIDPSERTIAVARLHAESQGLAIDYRATTAEALAAEGEAFDVVLALEVIEHVPDPRAFLATCHGLVRPGGLMIASTINRNAQSYLMAIVGAERVMRWLPRGTHDWRRFITPDELGDLMRAVGLDPVDRTGFAFDPLNWRFALSERDLRVNYALTALRP